MTVTSPDPAELSERLSRELPFEVRLAPPPRRAAVLEGGRKCALGTLPVAYSRWRLGTDAGPECALYQFRAEDFGLPPDLGAEERLVDCLPGEPRVCVVTVWSVHGRGYTLVVERAAGGGR